MRVAKAIVAVLVLVTLAPAPAWAHGGLSLGINLGVPYPYYYGPYYRPYPYYYYRPYPVYVAPAPVVVQAAPVVQPAYSSPAEAVPAPAAPTLVPPPQAVQPTGWGADAVAQQLQALNGADDRARADAAVQLGRLQARRAVQPLAQLMSADRSATVREAAARALGLIADPSALPALQRAAQADDDRDVRHSAQFAAETIRSTAQR